MAKQVAIIMGSKSDLKIMKGAIEALEEFNINYDIRVVSAHRTPEDMQQFALQAAAKGYKVIIAGAGGSAHLPGMVACLTYLPVLGVPVITGKLKGVDALLSMAQMPKGVPLATMPIDGAYNAGLQAVRILALQDRKLTLKLMKFQMGQKKKVKQMNREIQIEYSKKNKNSKPR